MKWQRAAAIVLILIFVSVGGILAGWSYFRQEAEKSNPDIYAWITIPGTKIDYPILQSSEDNRFYLTHDQNGEENPSGAIFTENYNSRNFRDPITVIYGNNMEDGTMFGELHRYSDNLFMEEHPYIYIQTEDRQLTYRVFAAYLSDNRHIMERFQSGKTEGNRKAYLDSILRNRSMGARIDESAEVTADSRILTLSTHDGSGEQYRYLVQAYLIEETSTEKNDAVSS